MKKLEEKPFDIKHRSYIFAVEVINLIRGFPRETASFVVSKQLVRSATSIGANLVESQASSSRKEFANFVRIALKSANETKFWLQLSADTNLSDSGKSKELLEEVIEIAKILGRISVSSRTETKTND